MKTRVSLKYFVTGCREQISAQTDNFDVLDRNFPKKGISGRKRINQKTCVCVDGRQLLY